MLLADGRAGITQPGVEASLNSRLGSKVWRGFSGDFSQLVNIPLMAIKIGWVEQFQISNSDVELEEIIFFSNEMVRYEIKMRL